MIKVTSCSTMGVVEYSITRASDVDNLPKSGLSNTSIAKGILEDKQLHIYMFRQDDLSVDGEWIEL